MCDSKGISVFLGSIIFTACYGVLMIPEPYVISMPHVLCKVEEGVLRQYGPFTILCFRKYKASFRIENLRS